MTSTLHVLYVEDSRFDADLTKSYFEQHAPDIDLEVVDSAERCLKRLETASYDVLLLDNHLPDMDGPQILGELSTRDISLPIVMVTGGGDDALVTQVWRRGVCDYVPKAGDYLERLPAVLRNAVAAYQLLGGLPPDAERPLHRVLYVEHNPADIDLTLKHFADVAPHVRIEVVRSSAEALTRLEEAGWDLVLVDLRMPDMSAVDLLREARHRHLNVPFIVVTGKGDETAAVTALKLGAYDYLVKRDEYLTHLPYAVDNAVGRFQLAHLNARLQSELRERARAEEHIRQLNLDLQQRVAARTRELEAAVQELEETAILELIVQNAPLTEILGRLASLVARYSRSMVSVMSFQAIERHSIGFRSALVPHASDSTVVDDPRTQATLAIAKPDGTFEAAVAPFAGLRLFETFAAAERLPSRIEFPIRSTVTHTDLGLFVLYQDADRELDDPVRRMIERCTKLGAIAINRVHTEEKIRRQALEDALTGLPNRVLFSDRFEQALAAARRDGLMVALLIYDLDRFKDINDTLGHDAGDRALRHAADQLSASIRPSDTVCRLGGDEFAVVLPRLTDANEAVEIARRGLAALEQPLQSDQFVLTLNASVGIAIHPAHGDDAGQLLRRADVAMYRCKRVGGSIAVYDPERDREQLESLSFVGELQRGIEGDQLILHYQPKIDLRTDRIIGVECLVRWQHPTRGLMPPIEFIARAESTGLIKPLSLWVIRDALRASRSWRDQGLDIPVAVNLSAPLLYDPDLPGTIDREMHALNIGPGQLEVEITESTLMVDPDRAMNTINRLRDIGIAFALDDFGTGYSSLAYLKSLPVQSIKIDKSFVRDMVTEEKDASIVRAAIELGHSFGLDVVAEGIESGEVRDLLRTSGCDSGQGFYFARPMPVSEFLHWCTGHPPRRP